MSLDWAGIALDASTALSEAGQQLTLRRVQGAVFDEVASTLVGGAPADTPFMGVVLPSLAMWPSGRSTDNVEAGTLFVLMGPYDLTGADIAPVRSDHVVVGGVAKAIADMEELSPGGVPVLYTLQLVP